MMVFFTPTSLRWLAHELTDCMIITELLRWIISPFIFFPCADHTGNLPLAGDASQGWKMNSTGSCFWGDKTHFPTNTNAEADPRPWLCPVVVTCGRQISPGNPWALSIFRANSATVRARKLLLLTAAMVCGVRGHRSRVFLLTLCIEFKQEQHSCGNTLLQLRRTPREEVLSSSAVMANKLFFFPLLCLSPSGLITPHTAFSHATNHNNTMHH